VQESTSCNIAIGSDIDDQHLDLPRYVFAAQAFIVHIPDIASIDLVC
jgi:hypothetical protein